MSTISSIVGWLCLLLVAFGLAGLGMGFLVRIVREWHERLVIRTLELRMRDVGVTMVSQVHWFSGSTRDAAIWLAIGRSLASGCSPDVAHIRDQAAPLIRFELEPPMLSQEVGHA